MRSNQSGIVVYSLTTWLVVSKMFCVPRCSEAIRPEDPIQPCRASGYQLLHVINDWQPARLNQQWVSGVWYPDLVMGCGPRSVKSAGLEFLQHDQYFDGCLVGRGISRYSKFSCGIPISWLNTFISWSNHYSLSVAYSESWRISSIVGQNASTCYKSKENHWIPFMF